MRRIIVCLIIFLTASPAFAFRLALPEPQSSPTATDIDIGDVRFNDVKKILKVEYMLFDAEGYPLYSKDGKTILREWICRDLPAGEGTPGSTCYTDVVMDDCEAADNGKPIGRRMWARIWLRMRPDVLKVAGNDIAP
jgi:hypothetical protein